MALEEISRFGDVPVDVEVELDRRVLTIKEILELEAGSVIGMTRSAGENIDLYVGGKLVGYGEIVLVENNIGVRITDFKTELRRKGTLRMRARTGGHNSRHLQKLERLVLGPHHALHLVRLDDRTILVAQSPAGLALLEGAPSNERMAAVSAARAGGDGRG